MKSPNFQRKSPPRVVFLIDTHYPTTSQHDTARDLEELRLAVLRILLYFHDHVDKRFTWGYQFFNPNGHTNLRHRADFHDLCVASLDTFTTALRSELDASQNDLISGTSTTSNPTTSNPPFTNLKTFLAQILSDFQWNYIDASYAASPIKQRRVVRSSFKTSKVPVIVKNQLYVLTPAPRSHSELATFVDGKSELQTFLTLEGERKKVLNLLDRVREEILAKNLWNEYVDQRIAINWVDTAAVAQEQTGRSAAQKDIDRFIQSHLASILHAFGGHLIPYVVLTEDLARHGVSFASIFHHYRDSSIDTTVGIGMRTRAKGGKRAGGDASETEEQEEERERVVWKGRVIVGLLEEEETVCEAKLCPMISAPPQPFSILDSATTPTNPSNLLRDVTAIRILSHLPTSRLRPSCFLTCDTQPNILFALFPCSADEHGLARLGRLLEVVRGRDEVLLVAFEGKSEEEAGAKVEGTTGMMVGRLALMEMVIEGCAAVRVMGEGVTEQELFEDDAGEDGEIQDSTQLHIPVEPLGTALFERWSGFLAEVVLPMGTDPSFELDVNIPDGFDVAPLVQQSTDYSELPLHKQDDSGRPLLDGELVAEEVGAQDDDDCRVVRQPSPRNLEELLEKLGERYLETLYIENSSLADFAAHGLRSLGGHLTLLETNTTDATELKSKLLDHLRRNMLISLSKFEEKYHSAVNLTKAKDETAAREAADNMANLDSQERKYFKLWCRVQGASAGGGSASVANGKLRMLKIREAQLQTLLLLETLCLHQQLGLDGFSQSTVTAAGTDKPTLSVSERSAGRKRKKSGVEDDAPEAQLDLYFDRLCIWDTIDSIEAQIDETGRAGQIGGEDDTVGMKRFWTEVVMKFYEQALPKTVASLWHKCGGDNLGMQSSPIRFSKRVLPKKLAEPSTKALSVKKLARRNSIAAANLASNRTSAALTGGGGGKATDAVQPAVRRVGVAVNTTLFRREVEMVNRAGASGKGPVAGLGNGTGKVERKAGAKRKVTTPKKMKTNTTGKSTEAPPPKMKIPSTPTTPRTRWYKDLDMDMTPTRRKNETLGKLPRGPKNIDYSASTPRRRPPRTAPGELMPRDPYNATWASPSNVPQTPEYNPRNPRKRLFVSPGEGDASTGAPVVEQTPKRLKRKLDEEAMITPVKKRKKRGGEEMDAADPFVVVKDTPVRRKRGGHDSSSMGSDSSPSKLDDNL